jgi:hypothetical protein
MRWFECMPERWEHEQEIARRFLDEVETGIDDEGLAFIRGTYSLCLNCGHELDRFRIRIVYPNEYPFWLCHPKVYLDSHRDVWLRGERAPDAHIEATWRMCLFVPGESGLDFANQDELIGLFAHIHTFLFRERVYQREVRQAETLKKPSAEWPGPQRAHGDPGLRQAIAAVGKRGRNAPCICGSGKKFKNCCWDRLRRK